MPSLDVDIVSDVICPWCLIGFVRLQQALDAAEVEGRLTFHPFQLDPTVPREGVDLRERLSKKYGLPAERVFERVEHAARESGIPLDYAKIHRTPNTLSAHVLLEAAKERGTQLELARALFDAYFLEGRDIGDESVLAAIATKHGFTEDEAITILQDENARTRAKEKAHAAAGEGISGVPFFIFDQKYAVSGAQPVETFVSVIKRVLEKRESAVPAHEH